MIQSAEEFVALRTSDDEQTYGRAASEHASIETWLDVVTRFPDMRIWVAHNKTLPLEILERPAHDPDRAVRESVAFKQKLDRQLFELLPQAPDETVRERIAHNRKAPIEILERLATDESSPVSDAARKRLNRPGFRPAAD